MDHQRRYGLDAWASGVPAVVHAGPPARAAVVGIDDRAARAMSRLASPARRPVVLSFPVNRGRARSYAPDRLAGVTYR